MAMSDTICAFSTPAGIGGIAVLRISGNDALRFALLALRHRSGRNVRLDDRRATMACLVSDNQIVDEVVATYFAEPRSYTGEDVVEIACHGSLYLQQRVLQLFLSLGARMAEPGEFTLRAFLNHKLDLSQSEAVADLIDSRTEAAHNLALSQMRGGYANELEQLRQQLIDFSALLELELDFTEEDLQFANRKHLSRLLEELSQRVRRLVDSFRLGNALKHGIPVAIVGAPNAGKSSLLNALLEEERAIVSTVPGTTRDTIEESFVVDGVQFRFVDTAGLRDSDDPVERMGIGRSLQAVSKAAIVLYVHDSTMPSLSLSDGVESLMSKCELEGKKMLLVVNKTDLSDEMPAEVPQAFHSVVAVSARQGTGIDELKSELYELVREDVRMQGDVLLTNARHYEAMCHLLEALGEVRKGMEVGLTPDLLAIDLRDALYHLGSITGKVSSEEILGSVFSRFCVGK